MINFKNNSTNSCLTEVIGGHISGSEASKPLPPLTHFHHHGQQAAGRGKVFLRDKFSNLALKMYEEFIDVETTFNV